MRNVIAILFLFSFFAGTAQTTKDYFGLYRGNGGSRCHLWYAGIISLYVEIRQDSNIEFRVIERNTKPVYDKFKDCQIEGFADTACSYVFMQPNVLMSRNGTDTVRVKIEDAGIR